MNIIVCFILKDEKIYEKGKHIKGNSDYNANIYNNKELI